MRTSPTKSTRSGWWGSFFSTFVSAFYPPNRAEIQRTIADIDGVLNQSSDAREKTRTAIDASDQVLGQSKQHRNGKFGLS